MHPIPYLLWLWQKLKKFSQCLWSIMLSLSLMNIFYNGLRRPWKDNQMPFHVCWSAKETRASGNSNKSHPPSFPSRLLPRRTGIFVSGTTTAPLPGKAGSRTHHSEARKPSPGIPERSKWQRPLESSLGEEKPPPLVSWNSCRALCFPGQDTWTWPRFDSPVQSPLKEQHYGWICKFPDLKVLNRTLGKLPLYFKQPD